MKNYKIKLTLNKQTIRDLSVAMLVNAAGGNSALCADTQQGTCTASCPTHQMSCGGKC